MTSRTPHGNLSDSVCCPGDGCVIKNKCGRYYEQEYRYPIFGMTPHQLPSGGCLYFMEKTND